MVNFETPKIVRNMHKNLRLRLRKTEKQWTFHERLQDFDIRSKTCALRYHQLSCCHEQFNMDPASSNFHQCVESNPHGRMLFIMKHFKVLSIKKYFLYMVKSGKLNKQQLPFGAKICQDICLHTLSVPRSKQFYESVARGKL